MSLLSLCVPYYRNPQMLAHQFKVWRDYREDVKAQIEVVIVDDASPEPAVDVPRPDGLPQLRIYRVLEDRPWHQHGARNLAANEAVGPWLLMTDMDHVLPNESAKRLLERIAGTRDCFYSFARLDAPDMKPKRLNGNLHPHQNTFCVTKRRYWDVGGYDERLCGFYGTDGYFIRRLIERGHAQHLEDVPVVRYPREVIADASTVDPQGGDPKAYRDRFRRMSHRSTVLAQGTPERLNFQWERVA